ncbi:MAG TPA: hypothetical protein VF532_16675 [Candidatus Angelobacter sp.]
MANAQKPDVPPPVTTPPADGQQPAQDTSKKSSQEKTGQTGVPDAQEEVVVQSVSFTRTPDLPQVKELGGHGNWFSENVDWLHFGPVGIRSADAFYTYLTEELAGSSSTSKLSAATFHANIAYDQRLQHTRLIWQYNPRLLEVDGHFSQQLTNQDSTLDLIFAPTSRFTFGITDWFSYYGRQNTLNDRALDRNAFTGSLMNPFLNNGAETLMNSFAIPLSYNTSARTAFSIAPFFNYLNVSLAADPSTATPATTQTLFQYGAKAQLNHNFSPRQSMGFFYTYQEAQERDFTQTTYYHSFGATFSRRLGRSFTLGGQLGGSRATQNERATWTGVGSVTATKTLRHSSLQVTYGRDASFSGFLTHGYSDYGWANYSQQLGRRASATSGFGYLSGPAQGRSFRGKYVEGGFTYALYRNISWFFGYTRFWQSANAAQVNTSNQQQFQVGLRWASTRKAGL